jgi:hypothetical protein
MLGDFFTNSSGHPGSDLKNLFSGDYWLGLDALHLLTRDRNFSLVIQVWDSDKRYLSAKYDNFRVGPEEDLYVLSLGPKSSGNLSDAMAYHGGQGSILQNSITAENFLDIILHKCPPAKKHAYINSLSMMDNNLGF